jgi:hypothetical protein
MCPCQEKTDHYIKHLYKVVIRGQGTPLYLGERCFINHGYPLSLCRALEKARRIIQNDVEHIVNLNEQELAAAIEVCKTTADLIIQNKYIPGILFLKEYGAIANDLFAIKLSLPPWLSFMLGSLARASIDNLPNIRAELRDKNRLTYKKQYDYLVKVNSIVYGRCCFINDMLKKIDEGEVLTPQQENAITAMMKKYDEALLQKTEEAFPFLLALNNGKITLLEQDAAVFPGQNYPIFQSMLRQVERGNALSEKQLELLRNKYKIYKIQYLKLQKYEQMSTLGLIQDYSQADQSGDFSTKQQIETVFETRGVCFEKINVAMETCLA